MLRAWPPGTLKRNTFAGMGACTMPLGRIHATAKLSSPPPSFIRADT